jgi:ankyrin repeat protein
LGVHLEISRLLVDAGADMDKAVTNATPLYIARLVHHSDIVEMLQRAGATG